MIAEIISLTASNKYFFSQHSGKMNPCRFVAVTSSEAAKIFNVYPQKVRMALSYENGRFLSHLKHSHLSRVVTRT